RRKPETLRRYAHRRRRKRDRMSDGERRDNRDEGTDPSKRDHQAKDEQQVIEPVENVLEPQRGEAKGRLVPARVEAHEARIAGVLKGPLGAPSRKEAKDRVRP